MAPVFAKLRAFRERLFGCFGRRADALFEILDSILAVGHVRSPVHLSLAPVHRRGWGSLYATLSKGSINADALRDLLARHPLGKHGSGSTPQVYAVDQSAWPRSDAEASPGHGYYYHPSRHFAGQPIVAGWAYQLVAELGFERDSSGSPAGLALFAPLYVLRGPREERMMLDRFGEEYRAYMERTGRVIPRLS